MSHESGEARHALIQSTRTWSSLEEVALAVAVASQSVRHLYVERRADRYRWSLACRGGGYPMLRVTARFLRVDHHRIVVGFRTLPNGLTIICADPNAIDEPDVWAVLEPATKITPQEAEELITGALQPRHRHHDDGALPS